MGLITDTKKSYYAGADNTFNSGDENYGNYRYISLEDIVSNFMFSYVGEGKIISRANRSDVLFHAKRGIQEFSYDISRVEKIQEVEIPASLSIPMPQDYVDLVSIHWVDSSGIEHFIPEGRITSKPSEAVVQDSDLNYTFNGTDLSTQDESTTETRFKSLNINNLSGADTDDDYLYNEDYMQDKLMAEGRRFGLEPELANSNGMYIVDIKNGKFTFSSNLSSLLINIRYVSDGLGTDDEMKVHKFAEEAIYKFTAHAILSAMVNVPEYIVRRFQKDRRAAMRNAKLRLYDLDPKKMVQTMRGKSKQIKH